MYTNVMSDKKLSITHTALIWVGIILILVGVVMTLFGFGSDAIAFEAVVFDAVELSTSHIGLVLIVIGALLSAFTCSRLPSDVRVFHAGKQSFSQTLAENGLVPFVTVASLALCLLIALILV